MRNTKNKPKQKKRTDFTHREFCLSLLLIAFLIAILEILAIIKGIDGTMFGLTTAGLGTIGGYILKGFLKRK